MGTIIYDPVTLTLEFDPFFENFNLANNFWIVGARALIFSHEYHMRQELSVSTNGFDLVTLTLVFDLLCENLLTFLITMELWGLELWYVIWVFLVTEPFHGYQYFLPCDLDLVFFSSSNEVWCRVGAANVHNFMLHAFFLFRTRVYFPIILLTELESMASVYRSRTSPQQRPLSSWVLYPSSSSSSSLRTPWAVTMPPPLSSQPRPRAAVTWWPVPSQRHS